jgi:hypothetical protein
MYRERQRGGNPLFSEPSLSCAQTDKIPGDVRPEKNRRKTSSTAKVRLKKYLLRFISLSPFCKVGGEKNLPTGK